MALKELFTGGTELIGNEFARDAQREAIRAQQKGIEDARKIGGAHYDSLDAAFGQDASTYNADLAAWRELAGQGGAELGAFDDTVDVAAFLDPAMAYRQEQAADVINQSAANAGGMFSGSGATAKALQDRSQAIASDEWGKAYGRADESMKGKYSRFIDKFNANRANEAQRLAGQKALLGQSSGGRDRMFNARGGKANLDMVSARQDAGLEADYHDMQGDYAKGQWGTIGKTGGDIMMGKEQYLKDLFAAKKAGTNSGGNL